MSDRVEIDIDDVDRRELVELQFEVLGEGGAFFSEMPAKKERRSTKSDDYSEEGRRKVDADGATEFAGMI